MTTTEPDDFLNHTCAYCGDVFEEDDSDNPPVLVDADEPNGKAWAHTACALAAGDLELEEERKPTLLEQLAAELDLDVALVRRAARRLILAEVEEDVEDVGLMTEAQVAAFDPERPRAILGVDLES